MSDEIQENEMSMQQMMADDLEIVKIFSRKESVNIYDVYLDSSVDSDPIPYREILYNLGRADSKDIFVFHLSSYGGDCQIGFQLCHAVKLSKARVIMQVEQPCYSLGAVLAVCGTGLVMWPKTHLMFHNYSGGNYGKGNELLDMTKSTNAWIHDSFEYFCMPFLSEQEMKMLKSDKDVYVWQKKEKNLKVRIKRHFK